MRWQPQILSGFSKKGSHLALDDIRESIMELKYYKEHFYSQLSSYFGAIVNGCRKS